MNEETGGFSPRNLDFLYRQALAGDGGAEAELFRLLRVRFIAIAKRRVQEDSLEDVVQDALRIVHAKYKVQKPARGILVWSYAVLRNVIGNYYQANRRRLGRETALEDLRVLPATAQVEPQAPGWGEDSPSSQAEMIQQLLPAIQALERQHPRCGRIFRSILASLEQGGGPQDISRRTWQMINKLEPDLLRGGFYVALHRCRSHLRRLLAEWQERSNHD
jgi:DNA-directed RNA polymerase specialized sigma24 family protein